MCPSYVWPENPFFMRVSPLLLLFGKSYQAHAVVSVCVFFYMLDSEPTHFTRQTRTLWLVLKHGGSVWEIRLGFRVRAGLSSRPSSFATVKSWFLSHLHHIYTSVLVFCRLMYGAGDDPGRFSCADVVWPLSVSEWKCGTLFRLRSAEWGRCLAQCFAAFIDVEI